MAKPVSFAQWSLEPYSIGMKLRALRTKKRLTLSRLAAETGLSTALLSKLETERMIPTLPTLASICKAYGVGLSYFFCEPTHHRMSITRRAHLEGDGRTAEPAKVTALNAPNENPCLVAEMIELTAAPHAPEDISSNVCAFVYVLEGRMQIVSAGMVQLLDAGDCAYMESRAPASWCAAGSHRCRILLVRPTQVPVK